MSSTNKTPNLGLCQWEPTDPFLREDMNGDFAKIDEAIGKMSRVKLFDVTIEETTQIVSLDFSEIDMDQFAELEMYFKLAENNKGMRINGITDGKYYRRLVNSGSYQNYININDGTFHFYLGSNSITLSAVDAYLIWSLSRENFTGLNTIELFSINTNYNFAPNDRITIWGVRR